MGTVEFFNVDANMMNCEPLTNTQKRVQAMFAL